MRYNYLRNGSLVRAGMEDSPTSVVEEHGSTTRQCRSCMHPCCHPTRFDVFTLYTAVRPLILDHSSPLHSGIFPGRESRTYRPSKINTCKRVPNFAVVGCTCREPLVPHSPVPIPVPSNRCTSCVRGYATRTGWYRNWYFLHNSLGLRVQGGCV